VAGLALAVGSTQFAQAVQAQENDTPTPVVFQAAGPNLASIQGTVDAFRAELGANNGNQAGPLPSGRREINWDGGGSTNTSVGARIFDVFLITRGARFTTRGQGFVQAPVEGLATLFNNPTYEDIFQAFSPVRLFSTIGSNLMGGQFFVPGGGELPAGTRGFGAIFSDVDRRNDTVISYYEADGTLLFQHVVPNTTTVDAGVSFLGVTFHNPRVASVKIKLGLSAPGPNDDATHDVVMMDDFIYGEPQMLQP
jgi:hypothetical protein